MRRFIIHLLIKHQQSKSPVSWAVRKVLNYRHLGWGWGEKSGIIKIEAGSESTVSAPSLEPGGSGTPCPGSGVVTHSWERRMKLCGSLPASLGSLLTLLGPPPFPSVCSACPVPGALQAGMQSCCKQAEGGKEAA